MTMRWRRRTTWVCRQDSRGEGHSPYMSRSMQEEEEEEHGAAGPSTREHIYDVDSMHEKLEDIGWTSEAAWDETLMITSNDAAQVDDVDDDLARELSFYNQV